MGTTSRRIPHLRLRLLQPVRHVHLAVHRCRGGEVLLCFVALARASIELAQAEVAVGDEGAHAARLGEGQRLAVVGLAALGIEPVGVGRDVTEQVERVGRGPGLTGRGRHRAVAQALRVVETAEHQRGSTQPPIERSEIADGQAVAVRLAASEPASRTPSPQRTSTHRFASWYVMRGGSLPSLQKILGHATLSMTMRYAHLSSDHLRDEMARTEFSPNRAQPRAHEAIAEGMLLAK